MAPEATESPGSSGDTPGCITVWLINALLAAEAVCLHRFVLTFRGKHDPMHPDAATFERVLTRALGPGDYADAFYERRISRSFRFQDGRVHEAGLSVSIGVGIRVIAGERAGYAYSDDLSPEALLATARVASLIAKDRTARERVAHLPSAPALAPSVYRPVEAR